MSSTIYYAVRVSRILLCNCSAYRYPHSVGTALCQSSVPDDLSVIPLKASHTALKRARDLISNGYI